jgi:rSAM/selenodomain-associated transferase 1
LYNHTLAIFKLKSALIIFVRNPVLGKVKTRLAEKLGKEHALSVYKKLLQHTRMITADISADRFVFYADYLNDNDQWSNGGYYKKLQSGDDLGDRMKHAFVSLFANGYKSIAVIGSDCFELTGGLIEEAFEALEKYQTVIGPANDGGYYLLGMNTFIEDVFKSKRWGTSTVLKDTIDTIISGRHSVKMLPTLSDVDDIEDLKKFPELFSLSSFSNL